MKKLLSISAFVLSVSSVLLVPFVSFSEPRNSMLASNGNEFMYGDEKPPYPLPDGVVAVKYIQSTGTQSIKMGVNIHAYDAIDARFDMQFMRTDIRQLQGFGGFQAFWGCTAKGFYELGSKNSLYAAGSRDKIDFTREYRESSAQFASKLYVNGDLCISMGSTRTETGDFQIFSLLNGYKLYACMYRVSLVINDVLVRDMIPVRFLNENDEWEGAMFDLVSESLFRNQGTGAFVIGPDL